MKILVVDNYDSFTYNLIHCIEGLSPTYEVTTYLNDTLDLEAINDYDVLVLSPGPGIPKTSGRLVEVIDRYWNQKPIRGVCLGHQALGEYFGGELYNLKEVYHGVSSCIEIIEQGRLYAQMGGTLEVGRYHSWAVKHLPPELIITALDAEGVVMSFEHCSLPICGVQYHPESIMTPLGREVLRNFFKGLAFSEH